MSALESKKGLIYLALVSAMLWVIASCSSDPTKDEPGTGGGVSSNIVGGTSSSSAVLPSSNSGPSSPSTTSSSSNSDVAGSSSSIAAGSSDSGEVGSSSSVGDPMNVTLSCTGLQETVAKGATIAEPTLTCSDGSEPSSKQWTGRPGGTTNPSWTVSQNTNTTSYNIKVTATCGTASNLAADCGTVTVGTPGSSSSVAGGSSSSRGGSSSSVTTGGTSSAGGGNKTCTLSKRSLTNERYASQTSNNDRVLDLTVPSGNGPFPLIIFVHGGGFTSGNKSSLSSPFSATNATNRGYAFASINHRLASNSQRGFPEGIEDILTAIRFLRAKADSLCLDPNRFAMTGFSAGGYHTGMVAVLSGATHDFDNSALGYPGVSSAVQVAVSQSALTDFTKLDAQQQELGGRWTMSTHYGSGSMLSQYLGITTTASNIPAKSNPLTYVSANTIPIMMQHGLSDNLVPWKQSELLVNEINKKASGRAILDTLKDQGHGNFSNSDLTSTVYNFLDRHLK